MSEVPDYTADAVAALALASEHEHDFSGWLSSVVTAAVKARGGWDAFEGRPGSWEAALVERLVLPDWWEAPDPAPERPETAPEGM
jgi:hypothetical protein